MAGPRTSRNLPLRRAWHGLCTGVAAARRSSEQGWSLAQTFPPVAASRGMLRILQLEDDPVDSQLTLRLLQESGLRVHLERVHTFASFKQSLEDHAPSLILADFTVPGVDALKALGVARELQPDVPFIFLSGTLGEDVAIETLKMGATDYVLKQRLGRLVPAVRRALQEAKVQLHRKQAEQELRESEGRYRALLELAPDAVVVLQQGRFVYVNAAALRLCGAGALEQMWGKSLARFLPAQEEGCMRQFTERLLREDSLGVSETRIRRLDGREVPVEVAGSRVEWLGQPALQATLRDITQRKRIEAELRSAQEHLVQANAGLEQTVQERTSQLRQTMQDLHGFSYAIMHDLRAPLRAMHSFATLVEREAGAGEAGHRLEYLQNIKAAAERLDHLLRDALDYTKVLQGRQPLAPVELEPLLRGIVSSYPNLQAAAADIEVQGPLPRVLGTEAALTQCLSNLLGNAVKFVAPGVRPHIRIWAEPAAAPPPTPFNAEPSDWVRLCIQDNGIGIAPEHQAHIFEMFQRLNPGSEGTGMGLAIVRKAVERLGGRVGLESGVGRGSRFWLELRCAGSWPVCRPQRAAVLKS